jgi:hypothetical protein
LERRIVNVVERNRRDDRAEDVLACDPHLVKHIGEDGRLDIATLRERAFCDTLAAGGHARALRAPDA